MKAAAFRFFAALKKISAKCWSQGAAVAIFYRASSLGFGIPADPLVPVQGSESLRVIDHAVMKDLECGVCYGFLGTWQNLTFSKKSLLLVTTSSQHAAPSTIRLPPMTKPYLNHKPTRKPHT